MFVSKDQSLALCLAVRLGECLLVMFGRLDQGLLCPFFAVSWISLFVVFVPVNVYKIISKASMSLV